MNVPLLEAVGINANVKHGPQKFSMAFFMVPMLYGTGSRHKTLREGLKKYNEAIAYSMDRG